MDDRGTVRLAVVIGIVVQALGLASRLATGTR